jgi:hypothetical protein
MLRRNKLLLNKSGKVFICSKIDVFLLRAAIIDKLSSVQQIAETKKVFCTVFGG